MKYCFDGFWITVTAAFNNLSEERIYSCITLYVPTLFIIILVAAAAITTTTTIALLPAPLAFSKPDFFSDIPVLLFVPPATSLTSYRDALGKGRQHNT